MSNMGSVWQIETHSTRQHLHQPKAKSIWVVTFAFKTIIMAKKSANKLRITQPAIERAMLGITLKDRTVMFPIPRPFCDVCLHFRRLYLWWNGSQLGPEELPVLLKICDFEEHTPFHKSTLHWIENSKAYFAPWLTLTFIQIKNCSTTESRRLWSTQSLCRQNANKLRIQRQRYCYNERRSTFSSERRCK